MKLSLGLNQARPVTASYSTRTSDPLDLRLLERNHVSKSNKTLRSGDSMMKAVIICDGLAFVAKASARLQRVGCRADVRACWTIKSWPASSLKKSATAEQNLIDAADAHLIVIAARHAQSLPSRLREWLERWAALRRIQDAALAVINDGIHADFIKTVSPELTMLVQKHGLNFIIDEGPDTRDAAKLAVRFPHDSELPLALERTRFEHPVMRDSFRRFGINE